MFDFNTTVNNNSTPRDEVSERHRFVYQKAIDAYNFHVNRYHTWMNYYALFNGALLVAFCTLLCATTQIIGGKGSVETEKVVLEGGALFLRNDYTILQIIVAVLGLFTSIWWILSIYGHRFWTLSWIRIICKYEKEYNFPYLYRLVMLDKKYDPDLKGSRMSCPLFEKKYAPKGFSTDKLTIKFVYSIIIAWLIAIVYTICGNDMFIKIINHIKENFISAIIIIFCVVCTLFCLAFCCGKDIFQRFFYSNISNKRREYEDGNENEN